MVLHVVLFRPKAGLSESDRASMFTALQAAATQIPSVRRFQVGARLQHGVSYEKVMAQDFPFAAVIEFDDLAGLQEYLQHPQHERLGSLFYALQEAALAYDYEVSRLDTGTSPATSSS